MSGGSRFFVDTNVLLYSVDARDERKRKAARVWLKALWEQGAGCLSWQVLHEFYVNAVRKVGVPAKEARDTVEVFCEWRPMDNTLVLIQRAWQWSDEAGLPFWDALIVAAAETGGCRWLLSEDFQTGRQLGGVTIVNPFLSGPDEFGLTGRSGPG
jgi:predicted nucleic acid-binding protein